MNVRILRKAGVDDDIAELAEYLLDRSENVAIRFVDAVQQTLKDLAQWPGIGSLKSYSNPALESIRSWRVKGFPNHLIFYRIIPDGILVLAVLHGSRDIERILSQRP